LFLNAGKTDAEAGKCQMLFYNLCEQKKIARGYVVTKSLDDFGLMTGLPQTGETACQIMRLPAPLLCYWMGASELIQPEFSD
jgi:hypothetical protein